MKNDNKFFKGLLSGLCVAGIGIAIFLMLNSSVIFDKTESANNETGKAQVNIEEESNSFINSEVQKKIDELMATIDNYYLEEINKQDLIEGIYAGLVYGLGDPYSVYYTKEELDSFYESASGRYSGIGATMSQNSETGIVTIVRPFENSPAAEAGILPGDMLYKVEDEDVVGMDLSVIVAKVKGEEGTIVKLTVVREGVADYIDIEVERREIEVPTITHKMLEDNIGYISIAQFDDVTYAQFRDALRALEALGMEKLIVDVRDNPGGGLRTVSNILDELLPKGLIVYTEDKHGNREEIKSDESNQFTKPLAVLVNGNSASASEIFAGAIQDYGTGTIVGTTTFGKGIVQSLLELEDGTAVKLTISKYYTPNGRNIHGIGITPDVVEELADEVKQQVTITVEEDNQLQKAIEILKGQ
jgi:C-terminal peptidase (prc)